MNKILYIVALSALWVGCQNTAPAGNASTSGDTSEKITIGDHYIIDGTAPVKEGARIFLYQYKDRVYTPVDSVALDSQGRFHFEGKTAEPLVYALRLNGSGKRAHLYIENSPISLILNPDWNFEFLRSSDGTQVFELYNRMALNNALDLPKEIKEAPASPQLAYFLARNAYRYDFPTLSALRKSLDKSLDNNPYIKELDLALEQLSKIQPGAEAPEIDLVDAQGKKVSLKDFRGKKLLVDFWASWCPDCRKASPELVALYKEQKDKGLEILSISLDEDTAAWQAAIAKDQYTWPQALAKGVWQSDAALTYALRWIPTYMLLDKDGKILARDIQLQSVIRER
jgi:thiol-disulfide isomerase and thioredoxin